jgi:hypothetical protein
MLAPRKIVRFGRWIYGLLIAVDARIRRVPVLGALWAPLMFACGIASRTSRLGLAGYRWVYRKVTAFDARTRHTEVLRFAWWPVVVLWWGLSRVIHHIFRFIGTVPYRFLARVAGTAIAFVLAFEVIHNWRAEQRWNSFRKRAVANGVALRLPAIPPPVIPKSENLAAGFPFNRAEKVQTVATFFHDSRWRPRGLIPLSSGRRPDFTVPFQGKRTRRLWAQRLREGKHLKESRLRESSPTAPSPRAFLDLFDGDVGNAWNLVLRKEARPKTQFERRIDPESGAVWRNVNSPMFTSVTELHVLRAVSLIELGRGREALPEIRGIWRLYDALKADEGMTAHCQLSVLGSGLDTIWAGLDKHAWSESDLGELDRLLVDTNLMAGYARAVRESQGCINEQFEGVLGQKLSQRLRVLVYLDLDDAFECTLSLRPNSSGNPFDRLKLMASGWATSRNLTVLRSLSDARIREEQLAVNEYLEQVRFKIATIERQHPEKQSAHGLLSIPQFRLPSQPLCFSDAGYQRNLTVEAVGVLTQLRQARTAIAIERFQRRENHLPDSLGELVPEYMTGVPLDPFDEKMMRYAIDGPDSYRLWAVGENLSDEMGIPGIPPVGKQSRSAPDIVWHRLPPR